MTKAKSSYILAGEGVYAPGLDSPLVGPSRLDNLSLHRHRLKSNFLFFDTHVELLTYAEASGNQGENWGTDQRKKPEGAMGDVIFWKTTDSGGPVPAPVPPDPAPVQK
jgi:prepilin-type processing-associated H-X9-DG protein